MEIIINISQKSKIIFSVLRMSKLNCVGYLDYNFLPLESWIHVLPELTARLFSSMNVSSCHLILSINIP